jgi:hypothetical protein
MVTYWSHVENSLLHYIVLTFLDQTIKTLDITTLIKILCHHQLTQPSGRGCHNFILVQVS